MTTALHTLRVEQGCESVDRDFCIPGGIDLSVEEYNRIYRSQAGSNPHFHHDFFEKCLLL
jgi:hypothetical protein